MNLRNLFSRIFAGDADRSPWGDFWFEPVTLATLSGAKVSADTAMRLAAVFRAVALVSGHMGMFPVNFYERGTHRKIKHPLLKLLNTRPNIWQNAFEWREMLQGHLELRGNAYNQIQADNRGQITALLPIHPDRIKIEPIGTDGNYRYRIRNSDGSDTPIARGEIWHIRGLSSNGLVGLSVIDYARESMGMGLSAQEYAARFFANDQKPSGGWIEYPGDFKDKEARKLFTEKVKDAVTGQRRHGILTLDKGMKYHEVGFTNKDAQFLELRKFSVTEIARWFGIPPHKLGDLDRATFSNIEQQALEYVQDALLPRSARWEAAIEADLLFDDEEIDITFDFRALLRGDSNQRAAYYASGINAGWLVRNQARDMEGMEPIDGLDDPLVPMAMAVAGDDPAPGAQTDAPPPKPTPEEPGDDDDANAAQLARVRSLLEREERLKSMVKTTAARLARRFAKAETVDCSVIAEALAVDVAVVADWVLTAPLDSEDELAASLEQLGVLQ